MPKLKSSLKPFLICAAVSALGGGSIASSADIPLADAPLFSSISVPGNLALTLSVEWPTANTPAYKSSANAYAATNTYIGYFDPEKCYEYQYNSTTPKNSYFAPKKYATSHACSSSSPALWSGNYLNWASMQSLDVFRWTLSGGSRVVDTTTQTILEKTYNTGQAGSGVYPDTAISNSSLITGATPFNWSVVRTSVQNYANNTNYGTVMWVTATNPSQLSGATQEDYTGTGTTSSSKVYRLYVRVLVCDPTVGVESNCKQYGSNYKPEGLMQKYAMKLRYSAFGYLNQGGSSRNGGVLRARMKYIGPTKPIPGSSDVTNPAAEWDAATGVMLQNPDSADASATTSRTLSEGGFSVTVSDSGAMNYLNKFGKVVPGTYKSNDPVSELYYSAVRYFKNLGNVPNFSSLSGSGSQATLKTWIDGFPVISDWDDPILYSCQKNFILGIGDINTWYDAGLPGTSLTGSETVPSQVTSDSTVNVTTATNMVGKLEGLGNIGQSYYNSGRADTYYIAGLAYDSHVKDIRTDLTGTQTINTYWMDVLENGYVSKNQYWLATKYGGFTVPSGFSPYSGSNGTSTIPGNAWYTTTDMASTNDHRPDNYFLADKPTAMVTGLNNAFSKIVAEASAAYSTTLSLTSLNFSVGVGNDNYSASYDPTTWTGSLFKTNLQLNSDGTLKSNDTVWNFRDILDSTSSTSRKIVTCCTSAGAGLPFQASNLSAGGLNSRTYYASFANVPGVSAASQSAANYVAYLRGDRSKEIANGGVYRTRSHLLGDIVNSRPYVVTSSTDPYTLDGYGNFKATTANRQNVVFFGANDGMFHAVNASSGAEMFAYVPSFVYGDSTSSASTGLASLGNPTFTHHFMVDGPLEETAVTFDIDFQDTPKKLAATGNPDWHTVVISGLGKGGKGYFALDVTDPSSWSNETAVASKVLWEFTDSTMGYSYGLPRPVRTKKYGWVVVMVSGYNNPDGKGYFYFIDPRTGELLEKIATPEGSLSSPINMRFVRAYMYDYTHAAVDALYAGDLQGNVWRLDVSASSGNYPTPKKIAKLTNAAGVPQPVTTITLIQGDTSPGSIAKMRYVIVGTGRLLADTDITNSDQQSIYVIQDGTRGEGGFYSDATLPSGMSYPITRSNLQENVKMAGITASTTKPMGWYYDLSSSAGIAERIVVNPTVAPSYPNIVEFTSEIPNGSVCSPAGTSYGYAFYVGTGKTILAAGAERHAFSGLVNGGSFALIGGQLIWIGGTSGGGIENMPLNPNLGVSSVIRLNWRIIPTAD